MAAAKLSAPGVIFIGLIVFPWLVATWLYSADRVIWECHLDFEMLVLSPDQTAERTLGSYSQFFYGNNLGFARISGRKVLVLQNDQTEVHNFHRFIDFKYAQAGPYLKNKVTKVTRLHGDTLNADHDLAFMSAPGMDAYFQVLKLGPNTYSFGRLGMPRQICQGRQGWLMPRLR